MSPAGSIRRAAGARVATNLAFGAIPFGLITSLHPHGSPRDALPTWLGVLAAFLAAILVSRGTNPPRSASDPLRRVLSCLLLGSSLAAIPWSLQSLEFFPVAFLTGFVTRWGLYALESRDLRAADRQRLPLPCLATRIRRAITWITGALIPLLVIAGLPAVPLLSLSFLFTAFAQWTSACENCLQAAPSAGR